jgi:hypothetical protein
MVGKLTVEILILWICYALYMAILVHRRGPIGGIFFYPKVMQERVIELGLITAEVLKRRRNYACVLLLTWMILVPLVMIVLCSIQQIIPEILRIVQKPIMVTVALSSVMCVLMANSLVHWQKLIPTFL